MRDVGFLEAGDAGIGKALQDHLDLDFLALMAGLVMGWITFLSSALVGTSLSSSAELPWRKPKVCLGCNSQSSQELAVEDSTIPRVACTRGDRFEAEVGQAKALEKDEIEEERV